MIAGTEERCHRAMAAEWLAEALRFPVPEVGFEDLPQDEHPLMPPQLRRVIAMPEAFDVIPYIGRTATIGGEVHRVVGPDPAQTGKAVLAVGDLASSPPVATHRRSLESSSRPGAATELHPPDGWTIGLLIVAAS